MDAVLQVEELRPLPRFVPCGGLRCRVTYVVMWKPCMLRVSGVGMSVHLDCAGDLIGRCGSSTLIL